AMLMPYNPPYYDKLIGAAGYSKVKDLLAWQITSETALNPKIARVTDAVKERSKLRVRPLDMKKFDRDVGIIRDLYNRGWEENWGAVAMTDDAMTLRA